MKYRVTNPYLFKSALCLYGWVLENKSGNYFISKIVSYNENRKKERHF